MLIQILLLVLGIVLLIKGADLMVGGASTLAKQYNISELAIGLTIVAFGTSAPELVVNVLASFQGYQDIVFGNVIGSNNFNLFVILGIAGLITPLAVQSSTVSKEIPISFLAVIILFLMANDFHSGGPNILSRLDGFILITLFGAFLYYVYRQLKTDIVPITKNQVVLGNSHNTLKIWAFITLGLAGLIIGGGLLVANAVKLATTLGVSEKLIGLTIVAAGTSLPELATTVMACLKKKNDIAIGNIIGSNIFNIFLIIAASSLITPIGYDALFNMDLYILAGGTIFLFASMFTKQKMKLDRPEAAILLIAYIGYMIYLVQQGSL